MIGSMVDRPLEPAPTGQATVGWTSISRVVRVDPAEAYRRWLEGRDARLPDEQEGLELAARPDAPRFAVFASGQDEVREPMSRSL